MAAALLFNTIHARAFVREFDKDRKILEEVTRQILLAGTSAPSAGNIQLRTFIAMEMKALKNSCMTCVKTKVFCKSD